MPGQKAKVGKWMIDIPPNSDVANVLETQGRLLVASVHGKDFAEVFTRAMLIMKSPSLVETVQATYWLLRKMAGSTSDPRVAGALDEYSITLEGALHEVGGVGEDPIPEWPVRH
jgi:hypothetical protein